MFRDLRSECNFGQVKARIINFNGNLEYSLQYPKGLKNINMGWKWNEFLRFHNLASYFKQWQLCHSILLPFIPSLAINLNMALDFSQA